MVDGYPNKRARTHKAIVRGAMTVVAERGMAALTAASIAQSAGVSTGTLYNHFDGVDAVSDAVAEQLATVFELGTSALARFTGDPAARLALGVWQVMDLPRTDRVYAQAFMRAMAERPAFRSGVRDLVATEVGKGVEAGAFHVGDPAVVTDALMGTVLQPMRSMLLGELGDVRVDVIELVLRLLGMSTEDIPQVLDRSLRTTSG